jgi:hypothetical protein
MKQEKKPITGQVMGQVRGRDLRQITMIIFAGAVNDPAAKKGCFLPSQWRTFF